MKSISKKIGIATIVLSSIFGQGCNDKTSEDKKINDIESKNYFGEIPTGYKSNMEMISGDFDKDGDLDLIVGAYDPRDYSSREGKLYFFENDGKGNFTLKKYK